MKTEMQKGFEAQRAAGINVDWFTWQIAWTDARALLAAGASDGQASDAAGERLSDSQLWRLFGSATSAVASFENFKIAYAAIEQERKNAK